MKKARVLLIRKEKWEQLLGGPHRWERGFREGSLENISRLHISKLIGECCCKIYNINVKKKKLWKTLEKGKPLDLLRGDFAWDLRCKFGILGPQQVLRN